MACLSSHGTMDLCELMIKRSHSVPLTNCELYTHGSIQRDPTMINGTGMSESNMPDAIKRNKTTLYAPEMQPNQLRSNVWQCLTSSVSSLEKPGKNLHDGRTTVYLDPACRGGEQPFSKPSPLQCLMQSCAKILQQVGCPSETNKHDHNPEPHIMSTVTLPKSANQRRTNPPSNLPQNEANILKHQFSPGYASSPLNNNLPSPSDIPTVINSSESDLSQKSPISNQSPFIINSSLFKQPPTSHQSATCGCNECTSLRLFLTTAHFWHLAASAFNWSNSSDWVAPNPAPLGLQWPINLKFPLSTGELKPPNLSFNSTRVPHGSMMGVENSTVSLNPPSTMPHCLDTVEKMQQSNPDDTAPLSHAIHSMTQGSEPNSVTLSNLIRLLTAPTMPFPSSEFK